MLLLGMNQNCVLMGGSCVHSILESSHVKFSCPPLKTFHLALEYALLPETIASIASPSIHRPFSWARSASGSNCYLALGRLYRVPPLFPSPSLVWIGTCSGAWGNMEPSTVLGRCRSSGAASHSFCTIKVGSAGLAVFFKLVGGERAPPWLLLLNHRVAKSGNFTQLLLHPTYWE